MLTDGRDSAVQLLLSSMADKSSRKVPSHTKAAAPFRRAGDAFRRPPHEQIPASYSRCDVQRCRLVLGRRVVYPGAASRKTAERAVGNQQGRERNRIRIRQTASHAQLTAAPTELPPNQLQPIDVRKGSNSVIDR